MKTQQELQLHYWGPLYDMVKEYNAKHDTNIQPWRCVRFSDTGTLFCDHPSFSPELGVHEFALTILYDDKRNEHRPVFVGDRLYDTSDWSLITVQYKEYAKHIDHDAYSWNPPTPKRTFKLNDVELPCPVRKGEGEYVSSVCGIEYYFTDYNDRNKVASAIANILIAARDKE